MRQLGGVIARGKDVGEQDEVVLPLVERLPGYLQRIEIRERHAHELGLPAFEVAHPRIPVRRVRALRVDGQAEIGESAITVEAESTTDIERQDDAIAALERSDRRSDLFDDAHDLVTENAAALH